MRRFLLALLAPAAFVPLTASAIDPGAVSGAVVITGETVTLTHAYAYIHEDGPRERELRVALVDRPVPQDSIAGARPLAIEKLARAKAVRGVLLRYDPDERRDSSVTVLDARPDVREALAPQPLKRRTKLVEYFRIESNRVRGELDGRFDEQLQVRSVRFSAPLFRGR